MKRFFSKTTKMTENHDTIKVKFKTDRITIIKNYYNTQVTLTKLNAVKCYGGFEISVESYFNF